MTVPGQGMPPYHRYVDEQLRTFAEEVAPTVRAEVARARRTVRS